MMPRSKRCARDQRREDRFRGEFRRHQLAGIGRRQEGTDQIVHDFDGDIVQHQRGHDLVGAEPGLGIAGNEAVGGAGNHAGQNAERDAERRGADGGERHERGEQGADIGLALHAHRELAGLENKGEGEAGQRQLGDVVDPQSHGAHARKRGAQQRAESLHRVFGRQHDDDEGHEQGNDQRRQGAPDFLARGLDLVGGQGGHLSAALTVSGDWVSMPSM